MIYGGLFDLDSKIKRRDELSDVINSTDFWSSSNKDNDLKETTKIIKNRETLQGAKSILNESVGFL